MYYFRGFFKHACNYSHLCSPEVVKKSTKGHTGRIADTGCTVTVLCRASQCPASRRTRRVYAGVFFPLSQIIIQYYQVHILNYIRYSCRSELSRKTFVFVLQMFKNSLNYCLGKPAIFGIYILSSGIRIIAQCSVVQSKIRMSSI